MLLLGFDPLNLVAQGPELGLERLDRLGGRHRGRAAGHQGRGRHDQQAGGEKGLDFGAISII